MKKIAANIIDSGRFVAVTFVKKNGELHTISGRTGVKKYLKPGSTPKNEVKYLTVNIRDTDGKYSQVHQVARDQIVEIRADGIQLSTNCASQYRKYI